jgi:ribosomal protein S6
MRKYELMMIVNPSLAQADTDALIASIESELTDAGSKILEKNHPGEQRLAYRIRTSDTGYYLLYTLEHEGTGGFFDISNSFNIKKDIWRYMFTKIED